MKSLNETYLKDWIKFGLSMDAKCLCILLDQNEYRPFYIFRDQDIITQMYNIYRYTSNLICVIDLNKDTTDVVPTIVNATNNFSISIEN